MESETLSSNFNIEKMENIKNIKEIESLFGKVEEIYFTNYKPERNELLKSSILNLIQLINDNLQISNSLSKEEISFLYSVKSFALDKFPEYSKESEESATKSLKLNPFIADNFNCIAHIMWKKPDIEKAIKYFKDALNLDPKNKTSLRSLSMIIRTKQVNSNEEKQTIAKESLDYAKKAISLDLKDSLSWYVYGNAYFYKAFIDKTQYNDLRFALSAYNKSQEKKSKYKNPDLYYNRGVVHAYLENYENAYQDFSEANNIDETLKSNDLCVNIINTVQSTCKLIKNQCGLKPKKLAQIITTIPSNLKDDIKYTIINTSGLVEGINTGKLITGKIISPVKSCFEVPISVVCVDFSGEFVCVSLYNISKEFLDTISYMSSTFVVLDPVLKIIKMNGVGEDKKIYEYPCIQVSDLQCLLVDGKFCSGFASSATLNSTFFN